MPDETRTEPVASETREPVQSSLLDRPPDLVEKTYLRWQELLLLRRRTDIEIAECERFLNEGAPSREYTTNGRFSGLCHCIRCQHDWTPKNRNVRRPQSCPQCGSHRWDREDYVGEAPEEFETRKPGSGRPPKRDIQHPGPRPILVPSPPQEPVRAPVETPVEIPESLRKYVIPATSDLPPPPRLRDFVVDRKTRFGED